MIQDDQGRIMVYKERGIKKRPVDTYSEERNNLGDQKDRC